MKFSVGASQPVCPNCYLFADRNVDVEHGRSPELPAEACLPLVAPIRHPASSRAGNTRVSGSFPGVKDPEPGTRGLILGDLGGGWAGPTTKEAEIGGLQQLRNGPARPAAFSGCGRAEESALS